MSSATPRPARSSARGTRLRRWWDWQSSEAGPPPIELPPAVEEQSASDDEGVVVGWWSGPPIFKGFRIRDHQYAWKVFFYRFVDPDSRTGERANFAGRLRGSRAVVLEAAGTVIFHSPPPGE